MPDLRAIEDFLCDEAALLDERRFEDWIELFTANGYYWAPARPNQSSPLEEISLFYDDVATMKLRVDRLRHPQIHSQTPPSRTSRIVTNARILDRESEAGSCTVRSKFVMMEYRPSVPEGLDRHFAGTYIHRLVRDGGRYKIAWKKALLVNCDARFSALAMYF